jgi:hypothetical protein
LYLTDKRKLSELFKIEEKNDLNPPLYGAPALPENYQLDTTLFSQYTQKYIKRTTIGNIEFKWSEVDEEISENFFFTIEFLDSRRCQIYFLYDFERNYLKRG